MSFTNPVRVREEKMFDLAVGTELMFIRSRSAPTTAATPTTAH